jgi:hypothetical protein
VLNKIIRTAIFSVLVALAFGSADSTVVGQIDTGGIDTGGIDTGGIDTGQTDNTTNTGGGESTSVGEGEGVGDLDNAVQIESSDDVRNQGFVGATAPGIQGLGFVGAASENSGPPLASGATFGGGVNNSVNSSFSAGGTNAGRGGGAGGFTSADNGIRVTRRSLRAKLRPSFSSPRPAPEQVSNRFTDHFFRQPDSQNFQGQYSIRIENRTAYINGSVDSRADSDRLVRQLRLEPGVYAIVNQLKILN